MGYIKGILAIARNSLYAVFVDIRGAFHSAFRDKINIHADLSHCDSTGEQNNHCRRSGLTFSLR